MAKELMKKVDADYSKFIAHRNVQEAIEGIDIIYEHADLGCYEKVNKWVDEHLQNIRNLLVEVKEALPEGEADDTFLMDSNQ